MAGIDPDVLKQLENALGSKFEQLAKSIDDLTEAVDGGFDPTKTSQSSARLFRNESRNRRRSDYGRIEFGGQRSRFGNILDEVEHSINDKLTKAVRNSTFGRALNSRLNSLVDELKIESIKDLPGKFAYDVAGKVFDNVANSAVGKMVSTGLSNVGTKLTTILEPMIDYLGGYAGIVGSVARALPPVAIALAIIGPILKSVVGDTIKVADDVLPLLKVGASILGALWGGLSRIVMAVATLGSSLLFEGLLKLASTGIDLFKPFQAFETLGKVGDDIKNIFTLIKSLTNRFYDEQSKNLKYQQERLQKDIETIVRKPFEILEEAAKSVQSAWDQNLKVIASTQQYSKAGVQDLMQRYAERLSKDGLSSYISGADITSNLTKVLQSGLSGKIAEEFALEATKLNAAIPTQDFFGYVEEYTVVFNNAIKSGKSQAKAIEIANKSLEDFASNALYASRVLNNGATTGLSSWENLYKSSVEIAQAAKSSNISKISSALTAVQGYLGAVAPDLASSITDAVVKLAVGGNDSSIVALRSLWGGNASNTEFLKEFVNNPGYALERIFTKLGAMFTDSSDAYMEKAEGYAELFGLSAEAFQRVDWQALGNAVLNMNYGSNEYAKNVKLLTSGQTTLTKEQQVNEQINKYLLEEGLSYVLDNEVARAVQEHMWQEQIARELQESTYGVEITGAALQLLTDLKMGVQQLFEFFNPFQKFERMTEDALFTVEEALLQRQDLKQILEYQKVGSGNAKELYGLMTTGKDLNLIGDYYSLLGLNSVSGVAKDITEKKVHEITGTVQSFTDDVIQKFTTLTAKNGDVVVDGLRPFETTNKLFSYLGINGVNDVNISTAKSLVSKLNDYVKDIPAVGKFNDWLKSAGFDINGALSAAGKTTEDLERIYNNAQFEQSLDARRQQLSNEQSFYESGSKFYSTTWDSYINQETSQWNGMFDRMDTITDLLKDYVTQFSEYFIQHSVYSKSYNADDVERIRQAEKNGTGDAILALAEALTANSTDLTDPMVQTNALLAKILIVATTIMQQGGSFGSTTLPETLGSMAMGGR